MAQEDGTESTKADEGMPRVPRCAEGAGTDREGAVPAEAPKEEKKNQLIKKNDKWRHAAFLIASGKYLDTEVADMCGYTRARISQLKKDSAFLAEIGRVKELVDKGMTKEFLLYTTLEEFLAAKRGTASRVKYLQMLWSGSGLLKDSASMTLEQRFSGKDENEILTVVRRKLTANPEIAKKVTDILSKQQGGNGSEPEPTTE